MVGEEFLGILKDAVSVFIAIPDLLGEGQVSPGDEFVQGFFVPILNYFGGLVA